MNFSEVGLPGVENDPTPRGIILHPSRPSQLAYIATSTFFPGILGAGQPPYRGRLPKYWGTVALSIPGSDPLIGEPCDKGG